MFRSKVFVLLPAIIGGMSEQEHLKWQKFWDDQAKVDDSYQAVRGDKIMPDCVQEYHDRKLVEMMNPESDNVLLDAGCGVGDQTMLLSRFVKQITAMDFSSVMADRCAKRLKEAGIANATAETADVTALPYPDQTFDRTMCIAVLTYLNPEEVDRAIEELTRVTKDGGLLVLHVKDLWSGTGMIVTFGRFIRGLIKGRPELEYQYRTHWWYKKKLRRHGIVEASYAYGTWTPFMPKRMMSWIASMEVKHRFFQNRWPHGKEYFIRTRIQNGG